MNNALLICPSDRPCVGWLAENEPLCAVPTAGRSLLEYWFCTLAIEKVEKVLVLADDRTEQIEAVAQGGVPWGIKVEVRAQPRELTPAEALLEFQKELGLAPVNKNLAVLDHFPGMSQFPMFMSYASWFSALKAWLPRAHTPDRVGPVEVSPGVWVGLRTRISPKAKLCSPCWIEDEVVIGDRAVVGPNSIVERGVFIDSDARVTSSYIGPETYVGRYSEVNKCIARGSTLINWQSASAIVVPDRFVLSSLRQHRQPEQSWFERMGLHSRLKSLFCRQ